MLVNMLQGSIIPNTKLKPIIRDIIYINRMLYLCFLDVLNEKWLFSCGINLRNLINISLRVPIEHTDEQYIRPKIIVINIQKIITPKDVGNNDGEI